MILLVSFNIFKVHKMNTTANTILKETVKKIDGAYAPATIRAYKANFERFMD